MRGLKRFWVSWYATRRNGPFTLHAPWWISGVRCSDDAKVVCAAILAKDEAAAKEAILVAHYTRPREVELRFCSEKPGDWDPFCDRFPRAAWMKWPDKKTKKKRAKKLAGGA